MTKSTITINGRLYDTITGMPVVGALHHSIKPVAGKQARAFNDIAPAPKPHKTQEVTAQPVAKPAAQSIHQTPQKSHTLYRKALKKPVVEPQTEPSQRHPLVQRFAPQDAIPVLEPQTETVPNNPKPEQAPVTLHPTVAKVLQKQAAQAHQAQHAQPSGTELKELLIKERLAEVSEAPKKPRTHWLSRQPRLVTILSSSLALLILGGYLTYMTLPSISMKVAASRAGVSASLPNYSPDGYSLNGPITYSPGEVVINYKSNTNTSGFKLSQQASGWDSQAVLDNYVTKQTDNYLTFSERGLTIFTFNNKAAWVNGGLLYRIEGDAALSSEQILRVATSM